MTNFILFFKQNISQVPQSGAPNQILLNQLSGPILKVMPILKANTSYQLTQGNISIWSTPWYSSWTTIYNDLIIQPTGFTYPNLVKDLWIPNQKTWNENLINTLFTPSAAITIKQTQIIDTDEQDLLCWKLTHDGKCTTKSAYYACLQVLYEQRQVDRPRKPNTQTIQLLNQVWKCKEMIPRIQTFAWRFLRKSLPTGARAGRYSKHIDKICCRCGMQEDEVHLFFTCPFVKAAWFIAPWYIKTDLIVYNCTNLTDIVLALLSMNHPHATIANIFTFMWCIWKSRNDILFQRKKGQPYQIFINAQALTNNLEVYDLNSSCKQENKQVQRKLITTRMSSPIQGSTISIDNYPQGTIIYTDAAWKKPILGVPQLQETGIGIYITDNSTQEGCRIKLQVSAQQQENAFHAEAKALSTAAKIANILQVDRPIYLTDNQVLAKTAAARTIRHPLLHWNARHHLADFFRQTTYVSPQVFHI